MIYDHTFIPYRYVVFMTDMTDRGLNPHGAEYQPVYLKAWLTGQQKRIFLRLYCFVRDVMEKGFVNPVTVWTDGERFSLHPGRNRILLYDLFPEFKLEAMVIAMNCNDSNKLKDKFDRIDPVLPYDDKFGNKEIRMKLDRRHGFKTVKCDHLYEFAIWNERYVGRIHRQNPHWLDDWKKLSKQKGFSLYTEDRYWWDIGKATKDDKYQVHDVKGIYQLFYQYYFDPKKTWDKHYYTKL